MKCRCEWIIIALAGARIFLAFLFLFFSIFLYLFLLFMSQTNAFIWRFLISQKKKKSFYFQHPKNESRERGGKNKCENMKLVRAKFVLEHDCKNEFYESQNFLTIPDKDGIRWRSSGLKSFDDLLNERSDSFINYQHFSSNEIWI